MPYRSKCAQCDERAVLKWTLFDGSVAALAPLCARHGAPLSDLLDLVGPATTGPATESIPKVNVRLKARPLNWEKPEEG